jgi:hypothetical protein
MNNHSQARKFGVKIEQTMSTNSVRKIVLHIKNYEYDKGAKTPV